MTITASQFNDLSKAVRACFQRLKAIGERLHADLNVSIPMRAVLETLVEEGPMTVPQIAQSKAVTRQHIQAIVDTLLDKKLVKLDDNPAHRRSSLVAVTTKGRDLFTEMRRREHRALAEIGRHLDRANIGVTLRTLSMLNDCLNDHLKEREDVS